MRRLKRLTHSLLAYSPSRSPSKPLRPHIIDMHILRKPAQPHPQVRYLPFLTCLTHFQMRLIFSLMVCDCYACASKIIVAKILCAAGLSWMHMPNPWMRMLSLRCVCSALRCTSQHPQAAFFPLVQVPLQARPQALVQQVNIFAGY